MQRKQTWEVAGTIAVGQDCVAHVGDMCHVLEDEDWRRFLERSWELGLDTTGCEWVPCGDFPVGAENVLMLYTMHGDGEYEIGRISRGFEIETDFQEENEYAPEIGRFGVDSGTFSIRVGKRIEESEHAQIPLEPGMYDILVRMEAGRAASVRMIRTYA